MHMIWKDTIAQEFKWVMVLDVVQAIDKKRSIRIIVKYFYPIISNQGEKICPSG